MQTIEYTTIDKSSWGNEPWQNEPDKKQWQDKATLLPCLVVIGLASAENMADNIWWFGFDCSHAGDYAPKSEAIYKEICKNNPQKWAEHEAIFGLGKSTGWGTVISYCDISYVESECASLAAQLSSVR